MLRFPRPAFPCALGVTNVEAARSEIQNPGQGMGPARIHLLLNHEDEVDAKARELAAMPGQSPVAVIDTESDGAVTFYFADGHVCSVLRKSPR